MEEKNIGPYQIVRPLARGGMGETLVARSPDGELVVLKTLLEHLVEEDEAQRCFREEIRIAGRLQHPNVVRFIDVIEHQGRQVLVLEYVDGCSARDLILDARQSQELVPPMAAAEIAAGAARGLHYAHSLADDKGNPLGLIHRDVSPANILISRQGEVKLIDFGVAKAWDAKDRTATGVVKGKVGYMSPEHTRCETLDARSDVFSMGTVLWELLVCDRLFAGDGPVGTAYKVLDAPIPKPSSRRQDIPAPIDAICMKALERNLDTRTQSAQDLELSLRRWIDRQDDKIDLGALVRERFPIGLPEARESAPTQIARPVAHNQNTVTAQVPRPGQVHLPPAPSGPLLNFPNSVNDLNNSDLSSTYIDQHIEQDMQGLRRRRMSWRVLSLLFAFVVVAGLSAAQLFFPTWFPSTSTIDNPRQAEAFYRYQQGQDWVIVNNLANVPPEKRGAAQRIDLAKAKLDIKKSDPAREKAIQKQLAELNRKLGGADGTFITWQDLAKGLAAPLLAIIMGMILLWLLSRGLRDGFVRATLRLLILFVGFASLYRVTTQGYMGQPGLQSLKSKETKAVQKSLSPALREWIEKKVHQAGADAMLGKQPKTD